METAQRPARKSRALEKMKTTPIAERTLWDSIGNHCRVEIYHIDISVFEVYFHDFNTSIPRRFIGDIGSCNLRVDLWLAKKKEAGFMEQLPSYTPDAWRA